MTRWIRIRIRIQTSWIRIRIQENRGGFGFSWIRIRATWIRIRIRIRDVRIRTSLDRIYRDTPSARIERLIPIWKQPSDGRLHTAASRYIEQLPANGRLAG